MPELDRAAKKGDFWAISTDHTAGFEVYVSRDSNNLSMSRETNTRARVTGNIRARQMCRRRGAAEADFASPRVTPADAYLDMAARR